MRLVDGAVLGLIKQRLEAPVGCRFVNLLVPRKLRPWPTVVHDEALQQIGD